MTERLVNVDRETPMLLPADMRTWVPEDDLVHLVISAVPAADDAGAGDLLLSERPDVLPTHRAGDLEQKLRQDIEELLAQAEKTDREGAADVRGEANLRDDQSRAGVAPVPPPKVDESLKVTVKAPA